MIASLLTLSLLLSTHGAPDKFWLKQGDANAEGSRPAVVEGVLLGEDATSYHVRVHGGEIVLPKAQVARVEKDDLTVEAIADQEKVAAQKRAEAEKAAEAAKSEADAKAVPAEATTQKGAEPAKETPASEPAAEEQPARYDAVRGRFVPGTAPTWRDQVRALEASYEATGSREVRKELRRARRAK